MIRYGRMDVRFLIPLYHILVKRLWERGFNDAAIAAPCLGLMESSVESSVEIDPKKKSQLLPSPHLGNSPSLQSIGAESLPSLDLPPSASQTLNGSLSRFSFSFSEQQSLSPIPPSTPTFLATAARVGPDAIDQIFSITLSNSRELWSPTIPDLNDKKSIIKISSLKNKYEAFRRKSKSKSWHDQNTHLFMRYSPLLFHH